MTRIANFIARRKAWQVFAGLIVPLVVLQLATTARMVQDMAHPPDLAQFDALMRESILEAFVMLGLFFSWLVSVGWVANLKIEAVPRPKTVWYFAAAIYAPAYAALAGCFFTASAVVGGIPFFVVPMHLLAMVAIFYVLGFTAKNLILAERQSPVSFFDYSGPFFLMWFFPIGVWFVQPRVNRLVARAPASPAAL